jgi:hypothetical protein
MSPRKTKSAKGLPKHTEHVKRSGNENGGREGSGWQEKGTSTLDIQHLPRFAAHRSAKMNTAVDHMGGPKVVHPPRAIGTEAIALLYHVQDFWMLPTRVPIRDTLVHPAKEAQGQQEANVVLRPFQSRRAKHLACPRQILVSDKSHLMHPALQGGVNPTISSTVPWLSASSFATAFNRARHPIHHPREGQLSIRPRLRVRRAMWL